VCKRRMMPSLGVKLESIHDVDVCGTQNGKSRLMTKRGFVKPLFLLLAVVLASHTAGAADWPQFRGPNGSGMGDGQPPVEFGPSQNLLWKTAVGAGLSSPVIAKGRVFLTDFDRATKQLSTLCLDQRTGEILWRRTVATVEIGKVHQIGSPAAPTPVTDGERVYVYFGSYGLLSYDFDGKLPSK
jgi:outer membrane protein assembly factor BamB